jgi:hypothetical protein
MLKWLTAEVLSNNTVLSEFMVKVVLSTLCRNCNTSTGIILIVDDTVLVEC